MAKESPLFQSSIDLFAHAIEHFNAGTEKDRKFVILHLANSVELIFKDLLLDLGISIYKGPKETISIHGARKHLEDKSIVIPEGNKLELLVDERNALQHRYGSPNDLTTTFHMQTVYNFFKQFLKDNYKQNIDEILNEFLSKKEVDNFLFMPSPTKDEMKKLNLLAKQHPAGALLASYAYLEQQINKLRDLLLKESKGYEALREKYDDLRRMTFSDPWRFFRWSSIHFNVDLEDKQWKEFDELRRNRNQVSHGRKENLTIKEVQKSIMFIKSLLPFIKEIEEKIRKIIDEENE